MKHTRAALLAGLTITAASVGAFVPAHANDSTVTTFTIEAAGGLAINAPTSANLGAFDSGSTVVSGELGTVTVSDNRGALLGNWTVNAAATRDFEYGTPAPDSTATPAHDVSRNLATYLSGTVTAEEGLGVGAGAGGLLAAPVIAATRVGVGNNEASWDPTISVPISAQAPVGTYETTIVHSFA